MWNWFHQKHFDVIVCHHITDLLQFDLLTAASLQEQQETAGRLQVSCDRSDESISVAELLTNISFIINSSLRCWHVVKDCTVS